MSWASFFSILPALKEVVLHIGARVRRTDATPAHTNHAPPTVIGTEALAGLRHALVMLPGTTWVGRDTRHGLGGAPIELGMIDLVAEH